MKKKFIPFAVLAAVSLFTTQAFAATSMFGEVPQRTHDNNIDDPLPWKQVANISSATTTDGTSQTFNVSGNGTAVAQNNTLVFPISSQNDDPTQWGELAAWDFSNWSNGQPKLAFANSIKGVSNSSPVIHDGVTYLAAAGALYGFDQSGNSIISNGNNVMNIYSASAANAPESQADSELINQVVSHPLYTTTADTGASQDLIWVSSQNGFIFAINPSTLARVYAINIGSRMDASPTLVTDTGGTPYIAVATAYSAGNKGGTGTLYIIDPRTGTVVSSLANPAGNNSPVVTAPVATGTGYIMWNDYAGDVFFARLNPDQWHSLTKISEWDQVDGSGQTTNQEAGFSTQTGQYILPFSSDSMVVYVDPNTSGSTPIPVPISGKSVSSPAISKDNIYVGDAGGYVDQLENVKGFTKEDAPYIGGTSGNVNGVQNLASVMESSLQSPVAGVGNIPTLAFAGNDGLHVWQSMGAIYSIGSDYTAQYTNGQAATFNQPITVKQISSNLTASMLGIANEEVDLSYSVDGGSDRYLTGFKVFNTDGSPVTSFQIPASDLAKIPTTWSDGKTHKVTFNVYANSNDAYGYTFDSADSGNNQKLASTTVTFSTQLESIKLSPTSETVQSGTPVNLSYQVSGMQAGDTVKVVPSGNGVGMWRVSGDKKATDSTTETEASTTNQIAVSYTAVVVDKNGNQVASDNTTITWSPGKGNQPLNPKDDTPSLYENPVTQKLDFGVNLTNWLWDHWPRMGDIGKVNAELINKSYNTIYDKDGNKEIAGGYLDYSITATSDNPYFQGFSKTGEVFAAPGDNAPVIINIPFNYTVAQRQDPRKGYFIKFTVNVWSKDKTIPGKPPTYIAALPDSDPSNDTAVLNMWIPSAPVVTR